MKKILFLLFTPRFSGAEIVIKSLINNDIWIDSYALVSDDYYEDISKNTFRTKYIRKLKRDSKNKITIVFSAINCVFGLTKTLLKLQKKYKFDIIHANNIALAAYIVVPRVLFYFLFPRVKFIWHNHNINYSSGSWEKKLEHLIFRFYDLTIVVSKAVLKNMSKNDRIKLVYNGIDTNLFKFDKETKQKLLLKYNLTNKTIIGIFGTISFDKGQLQLLQIYKQILQNINSIHLFIIGSFSSEVVEKQITGFANQLGKEKLTILDNVKNIHDYYSLIDVLVNTTSSKLSEPLGTTILEAMSCERIVLASRTGGTPEIIEDGVDGFMFTADDLKDLEQRLAYIINNINTLNHINRNARKKIIQKFNLGLMVKNFNKINGIINDENS